MLILLISFSLLCFCKSHLLKFRITHGHKIEASIPAQGDSRTLEQPRFHNKGCIVSWSISVKLGSLSVSLDENERRTGHSSAFVFDVYVDLARLAKISPSTSDYQEQVEKPLFNLNILLKNIRGNIRRAIRKEKAFLANAPDLTSISSSSSDLNVPQTSEDTLLESQDYSETQSHQLPLSSKVHSVTVELPEDCIEDDKNMDSSILHVDEKGIPHISVRFASDFKSKDMEWAIHPVCQVPMDLAFGYLEDIDSNGVLSYTELEKNILKYLGVIGTVEKSDAKSEEAKLLMYFLCFYYKSVQMYNNAGVTNMPFLSMQFVHLLRTDMGDVYDLVRPSKEQWDALAVKYGIPEDQVERLGLKLLFEQMLGSKKGIDILGTVSSIPRSAIAGIGGSKDFFDEISNPVVEMAFDAEKGVMSNSKESPDKSFLPEMRKLQDYFDYGQATDTITTTVSMDTIWNALVGQEEHRDPFHRYDDRIGETRIGWFKNVPTVSIMVRSERYYDYDAVVPSVKKMVEFFLAKFKLWHVQTVPLKGEHFDFDRVFSKAGYVEQKPGLISNLSNWVKKKK